MQELHRDHDREHVSRTDHDVIHADGEHHDPWPRRARRLWRSRRRATPGPRRRHCAGRAVATRPRPLAAVTTDMTPNTAQLPTAVMISPGGRPDQVRGRNQRAREDVGRCEVVRSLDEAGRHHGVGGPSGRDRGSRDRWPAAKAKAFAPVWRNRAAASMPALCAAQARPQHARRAGAGGSDHRR